MDNPYDAGARRTAARVFVCACSPGYSCFACGEVERLRSELDEASDELQRVHTELQATLTLADRLRALVAKVLLTLCHSYVLTEPEAGLFDPTPGLEREAAELSVPLDCATFQAINKRLGT